MIKPIDQLHRLAAGYQGFQASPLCLGGLNPMGGGQKLDELILGLSPLTVFESYLEVLSCRLVQ